MATTSIRLLATRWAARALAALLVACGGGGDDGAAPPIGPPVVVATAPVALTVIDTMGRLVAGAAVSSATGTATTDASGRATLVVATGSEQVVAVAKAGFAEQFKVLTLASGTTLSTPLRAMLIERAPAQGIAAIEAGGTAIGVHGVKVTFPANALVDAAGRPVTGAIEMRMTPVDVTDLDADAFPGLFEGVPTGAARTAILSFGTSELVPLKGNEKLRLATGKTAEIELPLYVNRLQDGTAIAVGSVIPLWSLTTATGLWLQEGSGTVVASAASPTGLAARATISHFSWWNMDQVARRASVNLTVVPSGPSAPAGTPVAIGASITAGSGPTSTATGNAVVGTAKTFQVAAAGSVTRFTAEVQTATQSCTGSVDVSPPVDTAVAANINLVCINLSVRLVRPAGATLTNSASPLSFLIEVDGNVPDTVELLVDGTAVASFTPQFFYRGFWDSASFAEGPHTLQARATLAGVVKRSGTASVVIDRTPPRMTSFTPAATVEVDRTTTFTVDFSETVLAAPFTLADAIRLFVTPIGSTAPQVIASTATLDTIGRKLTVVANAALPLGTAGLSWGGLRDVAGNVVAGTVSVSWNVARASPLGADTDYAFNAIRQNVAFARSPAGVLHVIRQEFTVDQLGGDVHALRFDGNAFVVIGPRINERRFGTALAMAIDSNGLIYAAIEQLDAGGVNAELLVRRYDAVANAWVTVVAPFPLGRSFNNSSFPQLALGAGNVPVLSFIGGAGFTLQAHRLNGGVWIPLGDAASFVFAATSMTLNGAGHPVIAYRQGFGGSNAEALRVVEHDGTLWKPFQDMDFAPNANTRLNVPQMATAADGRPWLAWKKNAEPIQLFRYDGTSFVAVPIVPVLTSSADGVGLAFLNGDPVIAGVTAAARVEVRRFRSGAWEPAAFYGPLRDFSPPRLIADGNSMLAGHANFGGNGPGIISVFRVAFP